MGLKERIIEFIDYQEIKPSSFEAKCGISNGAVSKMGENTRVAILDRISNVYPNLNMMWVRTGVGKMILDDNEQKKQKQFLNHPSPT